MTVDQVFIIKKLQNLDEMLVAYSAVTRMPFAICDDESFNDQVWIFTDQDKLKTFAEKYKEEKGCSCPMVAGGGVEPPSIGAKPIVLPLHHPAICQKKMRRNL